MPAPDWSRRDLVALVVPLLLGAALASRTEAQSESALRRVTAFDERKARELLTTQLPCLGCHAFEGSGGRIAPDLSTVRERRSREYIAAMIDDPQKTLPGSLMPKHSMLPATRDVVVRYLQSLSGNGSAGAPAVQPEQQGARNRDTPTLYRIWCASCHGATGRGDGSNADFLPVRPARHSDEGLMSSRSDDALYDTIAGGGSIMNRSPRMPAFGETLSPAEIRALVTYIRELCSCEGPQWSRDASPLSSGSR